MGCRCNKAKPPRIVNTTTTTLAVTTSGGVRFGLQAAGGLRTFPTLLEARAAQVRAGGGDVVQL